MTYSLCLQKIMSKITGAPKKIEQNLVTILVVWQFLSGFLLNPPNALWLWHRRKKIVSVVYFKMASKRDNRVKVSALLRAGHKWVRSQTFVRCFAQPSTRSRSAWTMAKVSTDVQAVVETLLRSTIVLRLMPVRLLTLSPSSMRFLIA